MEKICKNCKSFSKKPNWIGETHCCSSYHERVEAYNKLHKGDLNYLHFDAPDRGVRPYWTCGFFSPEL